MAQEILVTYKADVDKVTADVNKFIAANEKLGSTQGQVQKELDKTTKSADKLDKELAQTGKSAKGATDKVKGFSKSANTELSALSSTVQSIGLGIAGALGAAFTVDAVIQFGKASINAFLEAQENAEKLRFTITQVGGESEAAFQRLIDQSEKLQKITIFSDDSIQQAQNALATFGLTADQIEDLLPKLADFASATKTDIVQAANQVGQGLQGAGREFKKYGIEVSATASALDNYNAITQGMVRFTGAASAEAETLTGQLKQQANAADELQEQLGSKLAPIYVRLKTVLFEAALGILGFNKAAEQLAQTNNDAIANNILQTAQKLKASGKDVVVEFSKRADEIRAINDQTADNIEQKNREIRDRIAELSKQKLEVNPDDDRIIKGLQSQIEQYNKIIQVNDERIKGLTKVIETEQNALKNSARLLTVEQLRVKSLTDLNDLLKENSKGNDLISQQNVDNIRKVIAEQQKAAAEAERNKDVRVAGTEEEIKLIKRLGAEYNALFELLSDQDKAQLIELSIAGSGDLEADLKEKITQLEALFEQNQLEIPVSADPEGALPDFKKRYEQLYDELNRKGIDIPVNIEDVNLENFREAVAKEAAKVQSDAVIPDQLEMPPPDTTEFNDGIQDAYDKSLQGWFDHNDKVLDAAGQLFSALTDLYSAFAEREIQDINRTTEAQLDSLDKVDTANKNLLDDRKISEREFHNTQIKLEEDKVRVQAEADKKIRAIKRKQATIEKIAAIAQIAIETAKNIAATPTLIAFYTAIGAAQAAVVAAQPIPYEKGSKDTGSKGHMARVGEKGEEIVYMPAHSKVLPAKQTQTYGAALDAMYDNRFDKWVMEEYVAPKLVAQKQQHEQKEKKQFAQNITESLRVNVVTQPGKRSERVKIDNVDEFTEAIMRSTYQSPYRR